VARHESLLPREHGAYAEIAFPVLTGLTLAKPSIATVCFAVTAISFFLVHEPVAVLLGARGVRAKEMWRAAARKRLALLTITAVATGLTAMLLAPSQGRTVALLPLAAGAVLLPAFLSGRVKTLTAETLVIAALAGMVLPMAVSSSVEWSLAWAASGVWFVTFTLGTLAVHAIKAKTGKGVGAKWAVVATPVLGIATSVGGLFSISAGWLPATVGFALTLSGLLTTVLSIAPIHPRQLKRVGWTLVTANVATWVLLLAAG
jgi:hypothetical protein